MARHPAEQEVDALLLPFLSATDAEVDEILAVLLREHAEPVIRSVVESKLHAWHATAESHRGAEAEDLEHEALLQVITALRDCKEHRNTTIANFHGYVAVIAYHVCYRHFREKRPFRWKLKNNLRYLLTR